MKLRYDTRGHWFKGNTHIHSVASDGGKTFSEIAELYVAAGYDFLFRTDHWVASDIQKDSATYPLLWMDGVELDGEDESGAYYHVVCLGKLAGINRSGGFMQGLMQAKEQGALTILAHPHWSGNSLADALRWDFDGVEVYNHVCHWLNGKDGGHVHWDAVLAKDASTLAFAVDDAHLRPEHAGWNGGWIVVNAQHCSTQSIMSAIRAGNFYSSCGPELHSLNLNGNELLVESSPVQVARLVGPGPRGVRSGSFDAAPIETMRFQVPSDWDYCYLELEDKEGRRAWTNSLFIRE